MIKSLLLKLVVLSQILFSSASAFHSVLNFYNHKTVSRSIGTPKMTSSNADQDLVCLEELLSSCIDASMRGCNVIRRYKKNNETVSGNLKEAGEVKSVVTQADIDAQDAIISGLRSLWGEKLSIVGEEDDNEDQPTESSEEKHPLSCNLLEETVTSKTMVPMKDLTLFVDPVSHLILLGSPCLRRSYFWLGRSWMALVSLWKAESKMSVV
jgi:hypothetical protein